MKTTAKFVGEYIAIPLIITAASTAGLIVGAGLGGYVIKVAKIRQNSR